MPLPDDDDIARRPPLMTWHPSASARGYLRIAMAVRQPRSSRDFDWALVIRASPDAPGGDVTASLEGPE